VSKLFVISFAFCFFNQDTDDSFLGHQRALAEGHGRSNCETLFGMATIPGGNFILTCKPSSHKTIAAAAIRPP
jgi:hypothetical protein